MADSIIICGPQGSGKSLNGERLRKHYGLKRVVEAEDLLVGHVRPFPMHDALILATDWDARQLPNNLTRVSIEQAIRQAGGKAY